MYQITSEVYLDKYNECYKKVLVIRPAPKDDILKKISKLVNTEKLSPFKDRSPCCSEDYCKYIISVGYEILLVKSVLILGMLKVLILN